MKLIKLPMGCLSSRSSVTPSDRIGAEANNRKKQQQTTATSTTNHHNRQANGNTLNMSSSGKVSMNRDSSSMRHQTNMIDRGGGVEGTSSSGYDKANGAGNRRASLKKKKSISHDHSLGSSVETADDDIVSLLMDDKRGAGTNGGGHKSKHLKHSGGDDDHDHEDQQQQGQNSKNNNNSLNGDDDVNSAGDEDDEDEEGTNSMPSKRNEGSFDEEPNMELLRQYVAVDYEISQLEDKDALRVYHEKIEQLEQLERELDMISSEVEEVAGRSSVGVDLSRAPSVTGDGLNNMDSRTDLESNSMISGVSGNTSHRSWMYNGNSGNNGLNGKSMGDGNKASLKTTSTIVKGGKGGTSSTAGSQVVKGSRSYASSQRGGAGLTSANQMSYSTVEEVFNRKIILEKERDKLKKEVEIVILDCDKLQQRYKRRDEILDKLFDGRTGNGLENHLEQQLNWLLEQKHYVDQVFFAWKRAETLTSQTCEQFASALEMLKKLPKLEAPDERAEVAKSIERLLLKSRQDMEQAQKYNPNVDAPFFTDNETERFDKIIKTIQSEQMNPSDYSQILTVIQFAYKRAVSIRLWLEQILQTTIARDSFELAEEYKWIAIQLRKERINLIKSKLQDSPYRSMARSVQEQMARKQSLTDRHNKQQQQQHQQQQQQQHEVNRDSGIESEPNDLDIEEEIYRVLEMNKSRLENTSTIVGNAATMMDNRSSSSAAAAAALMSPVNNKQQLMVGGQQQQQNGAALSSASGSAESNQRDQLMQERVQRRVRGGQQLRLDQVEPPMLPSNHDASTGENNYSAGTTTSRDSAGARLVSGSSPTPTKLKVELDEEARQSLLKQVDQIHVRHKDRMERLRGSNRAKATEFITSKMQKVRQSASSATAANRSGQQ